MDKDKIILKLFSGVIFFVAGFGLLIVVMAFLPEETLAALPDSTLGVYLTFLSFGGVIVTIVAIVQIIKSKMQSKKQSKEKLTGSTFPSMQETAKFASQNSNNGNAAAVKPATDQSQEQIKTDRPLTSQAFNKKEFMGKYGSYISPRIPKNIENAEIQRKMLKELERAIPTVLTLMRDVQLQNKLYVEGKLEQVIIAEIAVKVDKLIQAANLEKAENDWNALSNDQLLDAFLLLDFYSYCMKSEATVHIRNAQERIGLALQARLSQAAQKTAADPVPVRLEGGNIHIDPAGFMLWLIKNGTSRMYEFRGAIPLTEKTPVISLYDGAKKTRDYCLQTEESEDFTGKYFHTSVRLGLHGDPSVPYAQIDGFVSDTPEERNMTLNDVGYRMEVYFFLSDPVGELRYEVIRGEDLAAKALKYPGYTTPSNVRLIGICPDCGKSFAFHSYAFYMMQADVAYSDDGLDCCKIEAPDIDKDAWAYETDGKTFRYYNSFSCPHCGSPYINYNKYRQNKVFGVSGCVHIGRKVYSAE